jgi:hypothetical protein
MQQLLLTGAHLNARALKYLIFDEIDYQMRPALRQYVVSLLQVC